MQVECLKNQQKTPKQRPRSSRPCPKSWQLIRPRRALLALGLGLDGHQPRLRAGACRPPPSTWSTTSSASGISSCSIRWWEWSWLATLIQGLTSFALTQTLSKAAQKLIAELRRRVQEHVGRLSVSYYDANKTGMLVSRIMSDVEGVRNLIGTGLVDFVGGLLTAVIAFAVLIRISPVMTAIAFGFLLVFGFGLRKAFRTIRPIFRERAKINAEVTGRLTESLGGVRVVKGYHAEAARARGVQLGRRAPAAKRLQDADRDFGHEPVVVDADGRHRRDRHVHGHAPDPGRQADAGRILHLHHVPRLPGRAAVSGGRHRHPDHRSASPGWSALAKFSTRPRKTKIPTAPSRCPRSAATSPSRMSPSPTSRRKPCCTTSRSTPGRER